MLTRRTLLATSAAVGVGARFVGAQAATPPGVVVMAKQIDDVISFDPAESYEFTDNEVDGNCYRKLIVPDAQNGTKIDGDLAEKWEISKDGQTFTFHMTRNAVFESGKPVTAADAEFSLQRAVFLNKTPGFILTQFGFTKDNVQKLIRATDDHTLIMQLPSQQAPSFVLYCLSANIGCVVEKATAMAHAENDDMGNGWLKTHTAGAGAFRLTSWAASDHIIVDANPHATTKPGVKRIVLQHVKDPAEQFLLLEKGGVDIARDLQADQLKSIPHNPNFHTESSGQASSMYIAMNQNMPELAKPEVHQAIKWAIDYNAIAKNITPMTWTVQQSFLPKGIPGALTEQPFTPDIGRAKTLMMQAGLPDGFNVTMDYVSQPPYDQIAQAVQADLGKIGIKVQLLPGENKQVITKTRARTAPACPAGLGFGLFRSELQRSGLLRQSGRLRQQQAEDPGVAEPFQEPATHQDGRKRCHGTGSRKAPGDLPRHAAAVLGCRALRHDAAEERGRHDGEEHQRSEDRSDA